jgi:tetratricopeptide (TPR) repeat protein
VYQKSNLSFKSSGKAIRGIAIAGLTLVLAACQTPPRPDTGQIAPEPVSKTHSESVSQTTTDTPGLSNGSSDLSPDLLYDLLVASIASQRNDANTALESLSRAAYHSRDKRIIAEAIQLAMQTENYQQATELARLLNSIDPDNYRVILFLANAQFELGESENALTLIIELASRQDQDRLYVFHEIASLLSEQNKDSILDMYFDQMEPFKDSPQANMVATLLAFRLEDPDYFTRSVKTTLELSPGWEAPAILKLTYLSRKDMELTRTYADTYLEQHPDKEKFRLQYARTLIQAESYDDALNQLDSILAVNSDSLDALFSSGLLFMDRNDLDSARSRLEQYFALDSQNDQVRLYLADIEIEDNNYSEAASYLYGVSPGRFYLEAQIKLAQVFAEQGDLEGGIRHLEQIDTSDEGERSRVLLEQDFLFRKFNMLDKAKETLDAGLERFPENPDLLYNRGLLAAQMELLELHEKDMRKLIQIQPENAHAYNALGYTLADKTDRLDEAMELISRANELLPDNPFILDSMGWVHYRLGNNAEAIRFLKQALDGRQDAEIAAHLGEVLWASGEQDEALNIWDQGIQWAPENTILKETIDRHSNTQSRFYELKKVHTFARTGKLPHRESMEAIRI